MTVPMYLATAAWLLLCLGYLNRKNRYRHVPLMLVGMGLDLSIVVYLEITRNAIATAVGFTLSAFEQLHIGTSSIALMLYVPVIVTGVLLWRGAGWGVRKWHVRIAITALAFRTAGFLLMFSLLGREG